MSDFNTSRWKDTDFAQQYRDNADIYIIERQRLFEIMKSFYRFFILDDTPKNILDLGCGDGIITSELLSVDDSISATLIDGSEDMLNQAKDRLNNFSQTTYIQASFQDMLKAHIVQQTYDLAISSQAIHHLTRDEKQRFYSLIYTYLRNGGYFINIDVTIAPTDDLEQWYMKLWQEWMDDKIAATGNTDASFDDVIQRYKNLQENSPDTLDDQLRMLGNTGFVNVDCFYKYGIFTVFGGSK